MLPADAESSLPLPLLVGFFTAEGAPERELITNARRHVRPGAMAGSLILVPFYMCMLGLMLCGSVADSRAVFFRGRWNAISLPSVATHLSTMRLVRVRGPKSSTVQRTCGLGSWWKAEWVGWFLLNGLGRWVVRVSANQ